MVAWLTVRARREVSRLIHTRGHKLALREVHRMRTWRTFAKPDGASLL